MNLRNPFRPKRHGNEKSHKLIPGMRMKSTVKPHRPWQYTAAGRAQTGHPRPCYRRRILVATENPEVIRSENIQKRYKNNPNFFRLRLQSLELRGQRSPGGTAVHREQCITHRRSAEWRVQTGGHQNTAPGRTDGYHGIPWNPFCVRNHDHYCVWHFINQWKMLLLSCMHNATRSELNLPP